ncbi:MAG: tetratricopeptide repeat protein [Bacteroides stercoris]
MVPNPLSQYAQFGRQRSLHPKYCLRRYNLQTKADAPLLAGESCHRQTVHAGSRPYFNDYLSPYPTEEYGKMYALPHYNLAYIAFHKKDYATAQDRFLKFIQLRKTGDATVLADAYNRVGDSLHDTSAARSKFPSKQCLYPGRESGRLPGGYHSYHQLALVSGLQKDYDGKITLLNRAGRQISEFALCRQCTLRKRPPRMCRGRNNSQAIVTLPELLGT